MQVFADNFTIIWALASCVCNYKYQIETEGVVVILKNTWHNI